MKKFFVIISTAAVFAALSCSKEAAQKIVENTPVNDEPVVSGVETVITANVPESKTTVEEDGTYKWNEGDAINVFGTDGTPCGKFTTDITDPSSSADFTGNVPEGKAPKFALYPYDASASCTSEGVISTVIPTEQDGTIASALSYAVSEDGKNFNFTNAVSVICLEFNASDNIRYVRIELPDAVAGNVNIKDGQILSATARTVSVSSNSALSGTIYFAIAPTTKSNIILYFRNIDGDTAVKSATLKSGFTGGHIKKLGLVQGLTFIKGALPGLFSRQDKSKVLFSRGNLRYQASSNTFSFATAQYTVIGPKGANTTSSTETRSTTDKWIDLFCWGTSGYDYGAKKYQPWSVWGTTGSDCGNGSKNLSLGDKSDWGYNSISNGGQTENYGWKTPSVGDWNYFFANVTGRVSSEKDKNKCYTKGTVANIKGFFCLPDVWTCPAAVTPPASYNDKSANWASNNWSADDWKLLEDSGMVFIPCGGWIGTGGSANGDGVQFKYWSSSYSSGTQAYLMSYNNGSFITNDAGTRSSCASVRLIYPIAL